MTSRWLRLFALILLVLIIDQVTKRIVMNALQLGESIDLIPFLSPLFRITYSQNTGAAFGFLPQGSDIFLIIAVVVTLAMIYYFPRLPAHAGLSRIGIGLLCGGALGNAIDRIDHGAVIDFIHYTIPGLISNVSNLADHAIVFGVLLILIESWRTGDEKKTAETTQ
ncbi:signal peptidase II [Anaerolineae bacterium CFX9]|jgi:signal peptidase II|nr:signal peptidase II [Anaerolineae bacterium CFX9]